MHLENISRVVISLAGLGLSEFVFPVKMIDSPDFFPQYSTIARALLMGVAVMFYRFRFVRGSVDNLRRGLTLE